ncbi:reverse transcriptase N-terminal domain-containing protein [Microseira sp. BLCC-F43]|uniref:reverse transcriptase N-terminal domain-containing protein n=1 Tax=Microseira sp. BLCC-F43 TaxID=3153602 RepID=UPI0035B7C2E2
MVNWKNIPWKKFHRHVYRLQRRIFNASQRGDVGTMRRLQKLLMKSFAAKCLAVRRVTQDNQGKSKAGVDGIKSLTPKQRLELVATLKLGTKAKARALGNDTKTRKGGKTSPRNSHNLRQSASRSGQTGFGTRVGSTV